MNNRIGSCEATSKRMIWPDICKGLGILLVVLGHSIGYTLSRKDDYDLYDNALRIINMWIYSFHMPLFFCVSGYLNKLSEDLKKHINVKKSLLQ